MQRGVVSLLRLIDSFAMFVALVSSPSTVFANEIDQLPASEQDQVRKGEQVSIFTDVGLPWPKGNIYQRVESTPEEAVAVYFDYELQASYIPRLGTSKISKVIDEATVEVDYLLKLPLGFGTESYTLKDHLSSYDDGASYQIAWNLVQSESTRISEGYVRFEKMGNGTLISYSHLIVSDRLGSSLSPAVEVGKNTLKEVVTSLVRQVEKERTTEPELLNKQIQSLRTALKS